MRNSALAILVIVFLHLCTFGQFSTSPANSSRKVITEEEYGFMLETFSCSTTTEQIMSVLINETLPANFKADEKAVFFKQIRAYYIETKLRDAARELIEDFNFKNDKVYTLDESKFAKCKNVRLIDKKQKAEVFAADGWSAFNLKLPDSNGYQRVSRIGFSRDKRQALIFIKSSCGVVCGEANLYFYAKEGKSWHEKISINFGYN